MCYNFLWRGEENEYTIYYYNKRNGVCYSHNTIHQQSHSKTKKKPHRQIIYTGNDFKRNGVYYRDSFLHYRRKDIFRSASAGLCT